MDHNGKQLDPDKAFPAEVLALREQGVPLPSWYAGPLYTGNGAIEAAKKLEAARSQATAPDPADDTAPADF